MNKIFLFFAFCFSMVIYAQTYNLVEAKDVHTNTDKFLYSLPKNAENALYLGKIQVSNASVDDKANFKAIYNKTKLTGANAFKINFPETIDGKVQKNHHAYEVLLYYYPFSESLEDTDMAYFINYGDKVKIKVNGTSVEIPKFHYYQLPLTLKIANVSTGGFLGSRIKLQAKEGSPQSPFYFSLSKAKLNGQSNEGYLSFKTGDIVRLDASFAQFLIALYQRVYLK